MIDERLLLVGQLLGVALASGLNLYATVAILGLASRLGWIADVPPDLRGLEDTLVIASATLLFLIEFIVDKVPHLDSLWDTIHTFIRPTAAALLALGAMSGLPLPLQAGAAILAGAIALAAHGAKAGLRLAINAAPRPVASVGISVAEDAAAVALALAALRFPTAALAAGGLSLALAALVGPRLWRAFVLGFRAMTARVRGFFGHARWRELDEVPAHLRSLLDPPRLGLASPRAARAALKGPPGVGAYRNGWLVATADGPVFLYRSLLRPRRLALPPIRDARVRRGIWADTLELDTNAFRCTIFVLKDGPPAERVLSDLTPAAL